MRAIKELKSFKVYTVIIMINAEKKIKGKLTAKHKILPTALEQSLKIQTN